MTTQSDPNVQSIYCIIFVWDLQAIAYFTKKCSTMPSNGLEKKVITKDCPVLHNKFIKKKVLEFVAQESMMLNLIVLKGFFSDFT